MSSLFDRLFGRKKTPVKVTPSADYNAAVAKAQAAHRNLMDVVLVLLRNHSMGMQLRTISQMTNLKSDTVMDILDDLIMAGEVQETTIEGRVIYKVV